MKWLNPVVALTLLVLWGPVTMHCTLETVPGFSFLQWCCGPDPAPPSDHDCSQDSCAAIESGFYKMEDNHPAVAPDWAGWIKSPAWAPTAQPPADSDPFRRAVLSAPPELPRSWQFARRTALPPRAPSLAA